MDLELALSTRSYLVSDGAMGTMLHRLGLDSSESPELWNLSHPDDVRNVHREYTSAGANLLTTNSFGGTRIKLSKCDLGDRVEEINAVAAGLASSCAGEETWVMGSMGPLGELLEPYGAVSRELAVEAFREQAQALAKSGVDALLFETFYDLAELAAALEAVAHIKLPVFATMSFDTGGRTMMGTSPEEAWNAVESWGLSAFGANCGMGAAEMLNVVRAMKQAGAQNLIAQPNAGLPSPGTDGSAEYAESPEDFGQLARQFRAAGCLIIGGCCGSTPEHIRSIRLALDSAEG